MEKRRLREIILDQIEAKGLTVAQVIDHTGMPEQYLDAILNDKQAKLPAFPYIRIHLIKLAEFLGLDAAQIILEYKTEFSRLVSGHNDMLPGNRFALPSSRKRYMIVAVVCIVIVGILVMAGGGLRGRPQLMLINPPIDSEDPFVVGESQIVLAGGIDPSDKLFINNQLTPVAVDGTFTREYQLSPELNTIQFKVQRFLGKEVVILKHVFYEEASSTKLIEDMGKTASSSEEQE